MKCIQLDGPVDLAGFRREARTLVRQGIAPADVEWSCGHEERSIWDALRGRGAGADCTRLPAAKAPLGTGAGLGMGTVDLATFTVPASYLDLCDSVVLHRHPQRFALMYRLLWRLRHEPGFWQDSLDPDRRRAEKFAREVRRDVHKMRAFVRFTPVPVAGGGADASRDGSVIREGEGVRHVAWFEPGHHIVEASAAFFVRRFTHMHWAILTPERSVQWDGRQLAFGPGANRRDAPSPDAGASLWLIYYRSIFNPARLKVDMMVKEMPRRYWVNLPEAQLIDGLVAEAGSRTGAMVDAEPGLPRKTRPMAKPVRLTADLHKHIPPG